MGKWIMKLKCLIPIILMLIIPLVFAQEITNCKPIVATKDLPCMIITTYTYPANCTTYLISIYDSTPLLLDTRNFTDYRETGRCNTTFNYTTRGSYIFNDSAGETGSIIIEDTDEMASLTIILFVGAITLSMFLLPRIIGQFSKHWFLDLVAKYSCYLIGLFLLTLVCAMVLTISSTFGVGVDSEMKFFLWIIQKTAQFTMMIMFIRFMFASVDLWRIKKYEKRMGY